MRNYVHIALICLTLFHCRIGNKVDRSSGEDAAGEDPSGESETDDSDSSALAVSSISTQDVDSDGKIDHVKITFNRAVTDSSLPGYVSASSLGGSQSAVKISGRSNVKFDPTVSGDSANDSVVYFIFDEAADYDTDEVVDVTLAAESAKDASDNAIAAVGSADISETDGAPPKATLVMGRQYRNQIRVVFSEPVYGPSDAAPGAGAFTYTNNAANGASGVSSMVTGNAGAQRLVVQTNRILESADFASDRLNIAAESLFDSEGNAILAGSLSIAKFREFDVNGDGYDDVITKAPLLDNGGTDRGAVFIFFGSASLTAAMTPTSADVTLSGTTDDHGFGMDLSQCDVDGDGLVDIVVGAWDNGSGDGQKVYVFLNSQLTTDLNDTAATMTMSGTVAGARFGMDIGCGDTDNDGFDDVIVGADLHDGGASSRGQAYIFNGSSSLPTAVNDTAADTTLTGGIDDINFGRFMEVGDVNGDGRNDLLVNATYNYDDDTGSISVFYGTSSGISTQTSSTADSTLKDNSGGSAYFGRMTLADANDDGLLDVISGAYGFDDDASSGGGVFIYYGGSLAASEDHTSSDIKITGDVASKYLGYHISATDDYDGDGKADLYVSTRESDVSGAVHIYSLGSITGAETTASADVIIAAEETGSYLGSNTRVADFNNDGTMDVMTGAYAFDGGGSWMGRIYLFTGGSLSGTINSSTANVKITGTVNNALLGL